MPPSPTFAEIEYAIQYGPVPILSTEVTDRPDLLHMRSPLLALPEVNSVWRFEFEGDSAAAELEIDRIVALHRGTLPLWWLVSPASKPAELERLLAVRGFSRDFEAIGISIETSAVIEDSNLPEIAIRIERIDATNFWKYWAVFGKTVVAANREWTLAALGGRFGRVEMFVASVDVPTGEAPIAAGAMRIFDDGTAYLQSGYVQEAYRHRGIYRALLAHRLRFLAEAGVRFAITLAKAETSAPICLKMGFREHGRYRMWKLGL